MATPTSRHENLKAANTVTVDSQIKAMHNDDEVLLARLGYKQGTSSAAGALLCVMTVYLVIN